MLDLSELDKIPEYQRSLEGQLFHSLRLQAALQVSVPDDLREKVEIQLEALFSTADEQIDGSRKFFRARIHEYDQIGAFEKDKMGAPPESKASLGRVQLAGQSTLYTAIKAETAIAEVRPSVGSQVSVAEFSVQQGCLLRVLNLTRYEGLLDKGPDGFTQQITKIHKAMSFSEREFSRQAHPNDPAKYLDTIYITQLIREKGFDGIAYRSLLHKGGVNYAFFSPDSLECVSDPVVWTVKSVEYKSEPVNKEYRSHHFSASSGS
ncbi:RES family NAD+ phosphorylase [Aquabacterium sp.]|uniref:RES family NAD+ phosphorylase n=1 Tax=Aquabacterium sp. TaxID=1872578 RepID=UPI0035AEE2DB